jgi:hypothetical protein
MFLMSHIFVWLETGLPFVNPLIFHIVHNYIIDKNAHKQYGDLVASHKTLSSAVGLRDAPPIKLHTEMTYM